MSSVQQLWPSVCESLQVRLVLVLVVVMMAVTMATGLSTNQIDTI
jgi:hypothetical protein